MQQDYLYEIDSEFFAKVLQIYYNLWLYLLNYIKSIREEVEICLEQLRNFELPAFSKKYYFKISSDENCALNTHNQAITMRQEALWGSYYTLSNIPLENFAFLYLAIMLENSVAFFSTNASLLSASL